MQLQDESGGIDWTDVVRVSSVSAQDASETPKLTAIAEFVQARAHTHDLQVRSGTHMHESLHSREGERRVISKRNRCKLKSAMRVNNESPV